MSDELELKISLDSTHGPAVLDLQGAVPYDITLGVRRGSSNLSRPLNILIDDSLFDIPRAFSTGLLRLVDLTIDAEIVLGSVNTSLLDSIGPRILSFPMRNRRLPRFEYDAIIPLRVGRFIKEAFVAGHQYRVELDARDLGVRWWKYGDETDLESQASNCTLPPSEQAKLVASRSAHRDFWVVDSLPKPPDISISLSLPSDVVHRSGSPSAIVWVSITNQEKQAVTIRSSGHQVFIHPCKPADVDPEFHRISSASPRPAICNFSITQISTGEDLSPQPRWCCTLTSGAGGYSRRGLTTLEPEISLVHEVPFLGLRTLERMGKGNEFVLRLRPSDVWWHGGTLDDMFGSKKTLERMPGPCLPLILESDDKLRFRVED